MSANEPNQMFDVLAHDGVLRVERWQPNPVVP